MSFQRKTKIVATVGPASESKEMLTNFAKAGVNIFRLNFSHGTHEDHLKRLKTVREISEELDTNLSVLQDLQGPKIRTQLVENNGVEIKAGNLLTFVMDETLMGTSERVGTTYTSMYLDVTVGERILMDDGNLEVKVLAIDKEKKEVITEVVYGGILKSKKGINLPGTKVSLPCLTEKDIKDLYFGLDNGVDWIALSFVRTAADIHDIKDRIKAYGKATKVIAKIETPFAIDNLDEIIEATDAIMVARGDLGVEIDGARVPHLQKLMVEKCTLAGKPVIVATQMLESMISNPVPTRAETSDVANAVLQGASATMLSGESASGAYPLKAVETMAHIQEVVEEQQNEIKIVKGDEASIYFKNHSLSNSGSKFPLNDRMIAGACRLARDTEAKAILCITNSGYTAFRLSAHRPKANLYVFTSNKAVKTEMGLLWGANVFYYESLGKDVEATVKGMTEILKSKGLLTKGDTFVTTLSVPSNQDLKTNTVQLGTVE
ncbi:pyruvate kinase [Arcicella aurantiaca]|uniref:Pyruvate kinase n=1 Tax=Arcicella aurantiaca TaxID=591202 RepID=A0A316DF92_9BACT|nr:pyruvate kinase [Arcicella aurantiaca]PWK16714.1 pyruvate kinase [Arcicella aurantiaca]